MFTSDMISRYFLFRMYTTTTTTNTIPHTLNQHTSPKMKDSS